MPKGYPNKKRLETPVLEPQTPAAIPPAPPSPAILSLQQQVVDLVAKRTDARQRLTESHSAYLLAQGQFQASQAELQGIEQEVQYRIGLIAQLENRQPMAPVLQMPPVPSMSGISSEPAVQQRAVQGYQDANDMVNRSHATRDPNALTGSMM